MRPKFSISTTFYIPNRYMNAFAEGSARVHFTEKQARDAVAMAERLVARMGEVVREGG